MPGGSVYIKLTNTNKMNKTQTTEQTNTQHLKPITQNLQCQMKLMKRIKVILWLSDQLPVLSDIRSSIQSAT
jgi:hypothetical protein